MNRFSMIIGGSVLLIATVTAISLAVLAPRSASAQTDPCWNSGYTGGFTWTEGQRHNCGWHTAHPADAPCSAQLHAAGCSCDWCSDHTGTPDGCPCPWCTAPAGDRPDTSSWHAHGGGCGCGWCSSHRDSTGSQPAEPASRHLHGCGCGWCSGTDAATVDGSGRAVHGHGCCCGCGIGSNPSPTAADPPVQRHGCGCGCC